MTSEKKYLLQTKCTSNAEEHDSERWIDEEKFNEIKQKAGKASEGCSVCSQIVKDEEGNVLLKIEGC